MLVLLEHGADPSLPLPMGVSLADRARGVGNDAELAAVLDLAITDRAAAIEQLRQLLLE